MSEQDFLADDIQAPKKKRGLPKWLLGCGCGCTILIIAMSVLGILAFKEMRDPDKQWPAMRETLYFDERPTELEMLVGLSIPFTDQKQYTLAQIGGDYTVTLYVFQGMAEVEALFMTEGKGLEKVAVPDNATIETLDVQGRSIRSMTDTGMSFIPDGLVGPGIRIDISTEEKNRVVELRVVKGKDALTDEEIIEFFSMFDVWHE